VLTKSLAGGELEALLRAFGQAEQALLAGGPAKVSTSWRPSWPLKR
jgi:hypothetical protein